jgi:hypothetical protein
MFMFRWKYVIGIATISLCVAFSSAQADTPSSFQKSCTNITVSRATLQAQCRKIDGTWNSTSIEITGIENINGVLKVTGASPSSYQKTCRDIGINGDVLMATCQKVDGSWQGTSLEVPGIANINGVLKYQ